MRAPAKHGLTLYFSNTKELSLGEFAKSDGIVKFSGEATNFAKGQSFLPAALHTAIIAQIHMKLYAIFYAHFFSMLAHSGWVSIRLSLIFLMAYAGGFILKTARSWMFCSWR